MELLQADLIRSRLSPGTRAWLKELVVDQEIASTNAALANRAAHENIDGVVCLAERQTAGRGRRGREWLSPFGRNIALSVGIAIDRPATRLGGLSLAIGLATIDGITRVTHCELALKWPNDVLLDGRKLAGILAQRSPSGPVVVGIGLNVGWAPEGAACLGTGIDPIAILTELLRALGAASIDRQARYRDLLDTLGREVRVEMPSGDLVGRAVDVDAEGRLTVIDACAITHHIDAGDVVHLRPM